MKQELTQNQNTDIEDYKLIQHQLNGNWREFYNNLDTVHKNVFWKRTIKEIYINKDTHKIEGFYFLIYGCRKSYYTVEYSYLLHPQATLVFYQ